MPVGTSGQTFRLFDRIVVGYDGNLGIGTTLATRKLHVENGGLYVNSIAGPNDIIDLSANSLTNVSSITVDSITSSGASLDFTSKDLSNVGTIFANALSLNGTTSDTMVVNTITTSNASSNVSFDGKNITNAYTASFTNDITVGGTITASNLNVIGDFTTINTVTSNTEQLNIINAGTGPALEVIQSGAHDVAIFRDGDNPAYYSMIIKDGGNVGIGTFTPLAALHVEGTTRLAGAVEITDVATLDSNLSVGGTAQVTGALSTLSTLGVTGAATLSSDLSVGGTAQVTGALSTLSTLGVTGATTLSSDLSVGGTAQVTGALSTLSTLGVTGAATLSSDLSVGGTAQVTGALSTLSTLAVTGASTLSSDLSVGGTAQVTGALSTLSTLAVTGASTLSSDLSVGGTAQVTGALSTLSTLGVTGAATLSSDLSVGGTAQVTGALSTLSTLGVTGAATLSSDLSVGGTAQVTGALTAQSTLGVTGITTLGSNLVVAEAATFSNSTTTLGTSTMMGAASVSVSSSSPAFAITQTGAGDLLTVLDGTTEVFTIIDGGNVGIGSTSPAYLLDAGVNSSALALRGTTYFKRGSMNKVSEFVDFGTVVSSGTNTVTLNLGWANTIADALSTFRVLATLHFVHADGVAYRKFDTLINAQDDSGNSLPAGVMDGDLTATFSSQFTNMDHSISRASGTSVNIAVSFDSTVSNYKVYAQFDVFAPDSLGDFSFSVI